MAVYPGDGLIVATPSGSTAHSLSAGGPILAPDVRAFAITPISPHALTHRPLVVGAGAVIRVRVAEDRHPVGLTLDGRTTRSLRQGDVVEIRRSPSACRFVLLRRPAYFAILRRKLHWGRNPRT